VRSLLALTASALAGLAAVIASLDGDADIVPFFVGLTLLGGIGAWATHPPYEGSRRRIAEGVTLLWVLAAVWVGVLLLMSVTVWQASGPPPRPEDTYLGLTATVYHVVGLYGGVALILASTFGADRWHQGRTRAASATRPA
jgi:hypothetical protein